MVCYQDLYRLLLWPVHMGYKGCEYLWELDLRTCSAHTALSCCLLSVQLGLLGGIFCVVMWAITLDNIVEEHHQHGEVGIW